MASTPRIVPFLWFDSEAEEAAQLYVDVFPGSRIVHVSRYGEAGKEIHGRPPGSAMTVEFELSGQPMTALNGGPHYTFNEAVSLQVFCDSQEEIDHFWDRLGEGGDPSAQRCGWLKDRFGLSWQIVPRAMKELFGGPGGQRAVAAMMKMRRLDIAELERASRGE